MNRLNKITKILLIGKLLILGDYYQIIQSFKLFLKTVMSKLCQKFSASVKQIQQEIGNNNSSGDKKLLEIVLK